jgi:hypothetical protein
MTAHENHNGRITTITEVDDEAELIKLQAKSVRMAEELGKRHGVQLGAQDVKLNTLSVYLEILLDSIGMKWHAKCEAERNFQKSIVDAEAQVARAKLTQPVDPSVSAAAEALLRKG